jgi:hypothetical protein
MANALRVAAQAVPDHAWRSLSPSGLAPTRPTEPVDAFVPTKAGPTKAGPTKPGRLGVTTALPAKRAEPDAPPTIAERPSRSRWIVPVLASAATAGVFVAVLALEKSRPDAALPSPPILPAHTDRAAAPDARAEAEAEANAATRIVVRPPVDAATPPRDAPDRHAYSTHEDHPDDVFAFSEASGFATCLRAKNVVLATGGQTRVLDRTEIAERCVDAAIQRLTPLNVAAASAYIAVAKDSDIPTTLAVPLIDFDVRRSPSSCNDSVIYDMLVYVLGQGEFVSERYLAPTKATIARCLKDETFRKDFLEELHSSDSNLAKGACVILTEQQLVTSCH